MKWIVSLLLYALLAPVFSQSILVEADAFNRLRQDSATIILDVRSGAEYQAIGHIPGAISINYLRKDFIAAVRDTLAATNPKKILVYCMSGHRSIEAVKLLHDAGIGPIYELRGGLLNWIGHKLPVEE